jgi:hypothetical protein
LREYLPPLPSHAASLTSAASGIAYHKEFDVDAGKPPFAAKNNQIAKVIKTPQK